MKRENLGKIEVFNKVFVDVGPGFLLSSRLSRDQCRLM